MPGAVVQTDDMEQTAVRSEADVTSIDVVEAVAAASGRDPLSLDPPLSRVVDTDALDRIVRCGSPTRITFRYAGHEVAVEGDGTVRVDGEPADGGR